MICFLIWLWMTNIIFDHSTELEIVNICECCLNKKKKKKKKKEHIQTSDFPTFCILTQHLFLVECWKSDYYIGTCAVRVTPPLLDW
ncbi:hypothetical protein T07_3380 [Trichinella nelsoni]|uniref:Secreted protein n=1 Tax=Trichinella nelsoni TaxID=6336 RepID=A0A0V0SEG6_9BILA|nr:hypothetical protein T07_3380 [Trichinella nelsoni]